MGNILTMTRDQRDALAVEMAHILKVQWEASAETLYINANGEIAFTVDNALPAQELQGRLRAVLTHATADFLGEAFVRAYLDTFLAKAGNLLAGPMSRDHKHFVMRMFDNGKKLRFSFHASLLLRLKEDVEADTRPRGGQSASPGKPKTPGIRGAASPMQFDEWLRALPRLSPQAMYDELGRLGYVGQDEARKAVCLMAYRHIRRVQAFHLEKVPVGDLPAKENVLLLGPTACGKTYLVELLFRDILTIPTFVADMTSFTETGYVGDSVSSLFPRLVDAAGGDPLKASAGVICIDEFDKIAAAGSRSLFSGQGACKDASGFGVQRELLKILESVRVEVPAGRPAPPQGFSTATVPFIACGAFSGLYAAIRGMNHLPRIGFRAEDGTSTPLRKTGVGEAVSEAQTVPVANFAAYGMLPELMGRFSRIVAMQPMCAAQLRDILHRNTIALYARELALDGVQLQIDGVVFDIMVDECIKAETGIRGLRTRLVRHLEDACFSAYSAQGRARRIRLTADAGNVRAVVETKPVRRVSSSATIIHNDSETSAA